MLNFNLEIIRFTKLFEIKVFLNLVVGINAIILFAYYICNVN